MKVVPPFRRNSVRAIASVVISLVSQAAPAALTVTTSSQQGVLPFTPSWAPASGSVIAGMNPTTASGNFSLDVSGRTVSSLTAGGSLTLSELPGNNTSTNYLTCGDGFGAGSLLIYTLPAAANGYNLTNITVYGGWKDNGRDQQAYAVSYATVASPNAFTTLTTVNYNPSVPANTASATRAVIADNSGAVIVSNVVALKFDFTSPASENGYCGYAAITVQGMVAGAPSGPPAAYPPAESPTSAATGITAGNQVTLSATAYGASPITYQWRTDGGTGGALTNIPGATGTNLTINTTGFALGTYRYDYVAANALGTNLSPAVPVALLAMTDIGAAAPTPGPFDIAQPANTAQNDDGLNYYTDNGASYGRWCGQTFTSGNNPNGYLLNSLAWKSAGNGNSFGNTQPYNLFLYTVASDGSRATLIANYKINGSGTENHWLQWQGLNVPLAPNQTYAYALGRDVTGGGWEHIGNQAGNPYAGGQLMTVAHTSGTGLVTYGTTGNSDATFDLGLTAYAAAAPRALLPTFAAGAWPVFAGGAGSFTLNEAALGTAPLSYQWWSDNGTGGALTPLVGATESNLVVAMGSLVAGNYNYAVVVSNASGTALSPTFTVNVLGPTAPVMVTNITPAPVSTHDPGEPAFFATAFTGTAPISYRWYFNNGFGPMLISPQANASAGSNTLVLPAVQLADDGVYSVVAQNAAGSTTSSVATLVLVPSAGMPPPAVTLPPVALLVSNSPGQVHLQWAQGTLQQATNLGGPWIPIATNLEATSQMLPTTNAAVYFRSAVARQPRIVNLYCFCRDQDFRIGNSQQVLFNATTQQVQLFKQYNLPATFALQHDALVDPNYQNYFKANLTTNDEIGAWWEITQTLVERAGLTWRGDHEWVSTANIAFSCGYTPAERLKLVDAYMADFHDIFGYYPKTVGSWYIDEVTLQYMQQQYGVIASANCKDQIGTDTYTLWGGYWNQAYYPSKLNSYMPAQTSAGQIDLPVFRLLGSDPIYQYGGFTPGIYTLEPVYSYSGGSPDWVAWYFNALIKQPSLAFGYTQAGQENAFGWDGMAAGLTSQAALIAAEARAGNIQVLTLAQAGTWFRQNYSVTPPTSVVALDDPKQQGRKSVWYDSRFYRLNLLWDNGTFYVRDIHGFDETVTAATHTNALATTYFDYEALPVMDGGQWSGNGGKPVGMWPVFVSGGSYLTPQGLPVVQELNPTDLRVTQPLSGGGAFTLSCTESNVTCRATNAAGQPLGWTWELAGGGPMAAAVQSVNATSLAFSYGGTSYHLQLDAGTCQQLGNGNIRLVPDASGTVVLNLNLSR